MSAPRATPPRRLLLTRPRPEIDRTRAAANAAGWEVLAFPLLHIAPLPWEAPDDSFDALLLTSPQGARHGWPLPAHLAGLPVYAVGERTAEVARERGFAVQSVGVSDGSASIAAAFADGVRRMLHLRGEDGASLHLPTGFDLVLRTVYRALPTPALSTATIAALRAGDLFSTLLFSPRTARIFAQLADTAGIDRADVRLVALSPAVARAAGHGWRAMSIAQQPSLAAMLESTDMLWQEEMHG